MNIDLPYNKGNKDFIYDDSFMNKIDGDAHLKLIDYIRIYLRIVRLTLLGRGWEKGETII